MKALRRIKTVLILLFVTCIIFASFFGVHKKEDFRTVDIIKGYKLGMQFTDSVVLTGTVDQESNEIENDEEAKNNEVLNEKNLKLTKQIIKNRLKGMNVGEYKIELDNETGNLTIKLQENDEIHEIENYLLSKGEFTIISKDTEEVLLNNSDVKSTKVIYGPSKEDQSTTVIYLQINFNKEGTKKLEEISQVYIASKNDENDEESIKYVSVMLDGQTLNTTYFGEKMSTGVLYIPITQGSDNETIVTYAKEVNNISTVINSGILPIEYSFDENAQETNIDQNKLFIGIAIPSGVLLIACIVLVFKFKAKGFISSFMQIGYIALLLLAVRYTNVIMTIQGMVAIGLSVALNYAFNFVMLTSLKDKPKVERTKITKFALWTIPVYVIAVILSFNSLTILSSFGMTLVWGSICLYLYNLTLSKKMFEMLSK